MILSLLSEEHKIIFLYSPKAGCTTAKLIFYDYVGIELPSFHFSVNSSIEWKSRHGKESPEPGGGILPENLEDYLVLQFCRNPYQRAVSSFLAHVEHGLGLDDGKNKCKQNLLSLVEFLLSIKNETLNCEHCLFHSKKQYMTDKVNEILKIEKLDQELIKINNKYKLNLKNISFQEHSYRAKIEKKQFPSIFLKSYEDYLDFEAVKLINELYAEDIDFFGYEKLKT